MLLTEKHIRIIKPMDSVSLYYNHKHFFSISLLAVCDSNYRFSFVDIGSYGKSSNSSVFNYSVLWKRLKNQSLNIPAQRHTIFFILLLEMNHLGCFIMF